MYCYQCEQKAKDVACTVKGVCGKDEETAMMQDILIHATKGVSNYAHRARKLGAKDKGVDAFIINSLFTTVTNVNFDAERIKTLIKHAGEVKEKAKKMYEDACAKEGKTPEKLGAPADWQAPKNDAEFEAQGKDAAIPQRFDKLGEDVTGLQELIMYGLKGMAAYADHAQILGVEDDEVYAFFHEALDYLTREPKDLDELLGMVLKTGEYNLKVMELLDKANTSTYGHPEPTKVRITPKKGKAIVVSGHDLKDMEELLKQTEGKGINVYTHSEMLPLNAYPELKKYSHFVGNYGGAWQDQRKEFDKFPGSILMTTNCIQKPKDSYKDRIFTTGLVAYPEVQHVSNKDFSPVIDAALKEEGFTEDEEEKYITVGFGRNAVMGVADKVVEAVKNGDIKHFFLVGGCDGAKPGRNYYTQLAEQIPEDCVILTLACGKYRFNKMEFGDIKGIPRLLDVGQCNDAYSAIKIAQALSDAFGTDVNNLPLSFVLSWFEQKAVCILLTLLHLGIKNMRLGPTMPAFVKPNVFKVLQDKFNLMPISTPEDDLKAMLA